MRVFQSQHKRPLDLLAIGAGGQVAAASAVFGVRGDVDVWDVASGALRSEYAMGERELTDLAFTPDGKHLFVGWERGIKVFDADLGRESTGALPSTLYPGSPKFACSLTGDLLLLTFSTHERGIIVCLEKKPESRFERRWSEGYGEKPGFRNTAIRFRNPAIRPDGKQVAVSSSSLLGDHPWSTIELRNAATGNLLSRIECDASEPQWQLAFSIDGSRLLARTGSRTVKLFDVNSGQPAGELVHRGRSYVTGTAVHPDGTVACTRNNGTVCFWNVEKNELVRTLDWKLGRLVSVAFSPDGSLGAAGTEDGQVIVWDVDA